MTPTPADVARLVAAARDALPLLYEWHFHGMLCRGCDRVVPAQEHQALCQVEYMAAALAAWPDIEEDRDDSAD